MQSRRQRLVISYQVANYSNETSKKLQKQQKKAKQMKLHLKIMTNRIWIYNSELDLLGEVFAWDGKTNSTKNFPILRSFCS